MTGALRRSVSFHSDHAESAASGAVLSRSSSELSSGAADHASKASLLSSGSVHGHKGSFTWDSRPYPTRADEYELLREVGKGATATVWEAACKAMGARVAVKLVDLDDASSNLEVLIKEAHVMKEQRHPNVLPLLCSFVHQQSLWMVMPFVSGGSLLDFMQNSHPNGLDEQSVASIMKEALKGLEYMHTHGRIHRDLKAANILMDENGHVMLADFGVSAQLERGERKAAALGEVRATGSAAAAQYLSRSTFVGTPCFMAPEVMEQTEGYGLAADIWSFGITLSELANGKAPYSAYSLTNIILRTCQGPPPTLDAHGAPNKKYSEALKDLVARCLARNPADRPSASQLLKHKFWKEAKDAKWLVKHLIAPQLEDGGGKVMRSVLSSTRLGRTLGGAASGAPKPMGRSKSSANLASVANLDTYAGVTLGGITTLSGDAAAALALLKKLTHPGWMEKKKAALKATHVRDCQAIAFVLIRKGGELLNKHGNAVGVGHGFILAKVPDSAAPMSPGSAPVLDTMPSAELVDRETSVNGHMPTIKSAGSMGLPALSAGRQDSFAESSDAATPSPPTPSPVTPLQSDYRETVPLFNAWAASASTVLPRPRTQSASSPRVTLPPAPVLSRWSAPSYFDIMVGNAHEGWLHHEAECAVLVSSGGALARFRDAPGDDQLETRRSSSVSDLALTGGGGGGEGDDGLLQAYSVVDGHLTPLQLAARGLHVNSDANARLYGEGASVADIFGGRVPQPAALEALYKELTCLEQAGLKEAAQKTVRMEKPKKYSEADIFTDYKMPTLFI